jgi:DNA-directed RNA polymerase specialized sigma24 family protein
MPSLSTPSIPARPSLSPASERRTLIDQYAMDRIDYRVARLQGALGLNEQDAEDARQDMLAELWVASSRFDPSRASRRTFVCGVLDQCYRELARKIKRSGRRPALNPISFETAFGPNSRDGAMPESGSSFAERADLRIDVEEALSPLPRRERLVAEDLKQFGKVADVARSRSMHRGSVYRSVGVIRERLLESGIDE